PDPACSRICGIGAGLHEPGAACAGADPGGAGCALSENAERTTIPPSPPGPPVQRTRRQRRPTGAPPPLPHPIIITTTVWLLLAVVIVAAAFVASERTPWLRLGDRADTWFLRLLA